MNTIAFGAELEAIKNELLKHNSCYTRMAYIAIMSLDNIRLSKHNHINAIEAKAALQNIIHTYNGVLESSVKTSDKT